MSLNSRLSYCRCLCCRWCCSRCLCCCLNLCLKGGICRSFHSCLLFLLSCTVSCFGCCSCRCRFSASAFVATKRSFRFSADDFSAAKFNCATFNSASLVDKACASSSNCCLFAITVLIASLFSFCFVQCLLYHVFALATFCC